MSEEMGLLHFPIRDHSESFLFAHLHFRLARFGENKCFVSGPSLIAFTPLWMDVCSTKHFPHPKPKRLSHIVWHNLIVN